MLFGFMFKGNSMEGADRIKKKKYRSVMRKMVLLPLLIMLLLSGAVFIIAAINYHQTMERAIENRLGNIRSGLAQLENEMGQSESTFSRYFTSERSPAILKRMSESDTYTDYFEPLADSLRFLEPVWKGKDLIDGIVLYFPNIPSLNFRSIPQKDLHDQITRLLEKEEAVYNQWFLLDTGTEPYIVYLMRNGSACCGCWMRAGHVLKLLGLEDAPELTGEIYVADLFGNHTLTDPALAGAFTEMQKSDAFIRANGVKYNNYEVKPTNRSIYLGLLVREGNLFDQMPLAHRLVFLFAVLGLLLTLTVVLWLNTRISRPIQMLVDAMERYGKGETEYRLEERNRKNIDEFDLLAHSLNQMMDQVNELEFNLYETKLKEQETQLKYISQQIRPHFILNALNVIYTYREEEFPLVKKMVIYLVNYFRYIVNLRVDFVELAQEFRHVENYLNIQKERTQNHIDFFVEWEQAVSDALIPPLILQTFVENSIKYAVSEKTLYIIVQAKEEPDGKLLIRASDTGQGFREETLEQIRRFLKTREDNGSLGVGIVNAVERMDILYHGEIELRVGNAPSGGAYTEILLPMLRQSS